MDGSQVQLVETKPDNVPQYLATFALTLSNFAVGCVLAFSSPSSEQLLAQPNDTQSLNSTLCEGERSLSLSDEQFSWFSSIVNVGAMLGALIGGLLLKTIGRRFTVLSAVLPFITGWLLIHFADTFALLVSGRVVTGLCCGLVSLSVPTYIGEIASPNIRGTLAGSFQLMATIGFLYAYGIGAVTCWQDLALVCLAPALLSFVLVIFIHDSPTFLVAKGRDEKAKESLEHYRGRNFNVLPEMVRLKTTATENRNKKVTLRDIMRTNVLKPLGITLAIMFFQQASGINAVLFNMDTIFQSAGSGLSSSVSSIIVAVVQVVMTAVATVLMDRAGRKLLLMVSGSVMCLSQVAMGTYFYLKDNSYPAADRLGWLPLTSLVVFVSVFSLGYGPIPWVLMGEMFSSDVREVASSIATITTWGMSFAVTLIYYPLTEWIGNSGVYWLFAVVCALNFVFCLVFVKETKGKTIDEITAMF